MSNSALGKGLTMAFRSIRSTVLIPALVLILGTGIGTAALSFLNARSAVNHMGHELRAELSLRVVERLRWFLSQAPGMLRANVRLLEAGLISMTDSGLLQRHFWGQVLINDAVTTIYFGNQAGGLVGAGRDGPGGKLYLTGTENFAAGPWAKVWVDDDGNPGSRSMRIANFDARLRPWYQGGAKAADIAWGDIFVLFTGDDMALAPSLAVHDQRQQVAGVVATDIFISHIASFLRDLQGARPGLTFVLESGGLMVASSADERPLVALGQGLAPRRLMGADMRTPEISQAVRAIEREVGSLGAVVGSTQLSTEIAGQRHFVEVTPFSAIPGLSWLVATVAPEDAYLGRVTEGNTTTLAVIAAMLMLTLMIGVRLAGSITQPIRRIREASQRISAGDLAVRIEDSRHDELGELARAFNTMATTLGRAAETQVTQLHELRDAEAQVRRLNQELEQQVSTRTHQLVERIEQDLLTQEELRKAKDEAERASRAKSEFLANMSHELRTPLNSIVGYSDAILSGTFGPIDNPKHAEYVRDIHRSGRYLTDLINDILDLSAVEAGKVELKDGLFTVAELVAATRPQIRARAVEAGVELVFDLHDDLPALLVDERRVKQMLLNLMSNSVKFTPPGGRVTVSAAEAGDGLTLRVADTGIGMTADEIERARTRFGRVDSHLARVHAGTGLGLPVTESLIVLHGGIMDIDSVKGRGTTVSLWFPPSRVVRPTAEGD
ncbi:hypothetical protein A6A05_08140 [Magnetospirillum moscoviense]|uniref:histidine kinase n=2 Tax=Magnetospirillum moscoviense TaxID=1437059 RepID=A0A178MZB6_9PROT|nr:hypothetical protein A6A05_08140 [Magnetospirillum moscoviense]